MVDSHAGVVGSSHCLGNEYNNSMPIVPASSVTSCHGSVDSYSADTGYSSSLEEHNRVSGRFVPKLA